MGPESSGRIGRIIVHRSIPTRAFDVLKDPSIDGSDADLMASTAMQIRIREDMRAAADMVNGPKCCASRSKTRRTRTRAAAGRTKIRRNEDHEHARRTRKRLFPSRRERS